MLLRPDSIGSQWVVEASLNLELRTIELRTCPPLKRQPNGGIAAVCLSASFWEGGATGRYPPNYKHFMKTNTSFYAGGNVWLRFGEGN